MPPLQRQQEPDLYLRVLKGTEGGEGGDLAGALGDVAVKARRGIEEVLRAFINALHFALEATGTPSPFTACCCGTAPEEPPLTFITLKMMISPLAPGVRGSTWRRSEYLDKQTPTGQEKGRIHQGAGSTRRSRLEKVRPTFTGMSQQCGPAVTHEQTLLTQPRQLQTHTHTQTTHYTNNITECVSRSLL